MKIVFEGSELKEGVIWGKLIEVILINTQILTMLLSQRV